MHEYGLRPLIMNDAQPSCVGGLNHQTNCHHCHPGDAAAAPRLTADRDGMVCSMSLLGLQQGSDLVQYDNLTPTQLNLGPPYGSQIAFLPVRIQNCQKFKHFGEQNTENKPFNTDTHTSSATNAVGPSFPRREGGHCSCCRFNDIRKTFSNTGGQLWGDFGANREQATRPTPLLQVSPSNTPWCNSYSNEYDGHHHKLAPRNYTPTNTDSTLNHHRLHRIHSVDDRMLDGHIQVLNHQTENLDNQCNSCSQARSDLGCHGNSPIPRVVLGPPSDNNSPTIQLLERQGPFLNLNLNNVTNPGLLHSKSDGTLSPTHQELCQMAGGNIMNQQNNLHRHSTGNVYENVDMRNDIDPFRERAFRGSSWGGIVSCSSGSNSMESGPSASTTTESPSLLLNSTEFPDVKRQLSSETSHSHESEMTTSSLPDSSGDVCFVGSSSGSDSSGETDDFSVASWAQNFTGAAENESHWKTLKNSTRKLSKSGFYYEHMSMEQAKLMLKDKPVGTFLLRDSSHRGYLFSISAKTTRGVTSVRIEYKNSQFTLDCDEKLQSQTPSFDCVLKLIQYYVGLSENKRKNKCVWLESSGRRDTPVLLLKPALQNFQSLAQLCRKTIHKNLDIEKLSQHLKTDFASLQYLREYPSHI